MLILVAAVMFGAAGMVIGGVIGSVVGLAIPLVYSWHVRRLRGQARGGRYRL